jgi:hypothetical protein
VYHATVLSLLLAAFLASAAEIERVMALVDGVPVLLSDVQLCEAGGLVPRGEGEDDASYRASVVEALIALELRWQDLASAGAVERVAVDLDAAWRKIEKRAGGGEVLRQRLAGLGLAEPTLRELVRRAATVEAYAARRFAPFLRVTAEEVETVWQRRLASELAAQGVTAPSLDEVREQVEALIREEKLATEIERWTRELASRHQVVRYRR